MYAGEMLVMLTSIYSLQSIFKVFLPQSKTNLKINNHEIIICLLLSLHAYLKA